MSRDVDHPERDAGWNYQVRRETPMSRLDRNWGELLQELRVTQTGVQLLTGLLLTVPFQARFTTLLAHQRVIYLVTLSLSVLATGLLLSPVVLHRVLFRQHARQILLSAGQRFALTGFATLGFAVVGVIVLIFGVVLGPIGAIIAGVITVAVLVGLWILVPVALRKRASEEEGAEEEEEELG